MSGITDGLHSFSAIVFLVILFFPFYIRRHLFREQELSAHTLKLWRFIFMLAHFFLIISLLTGIVMAYQADSSFQWVISPWFISVMIVFLILGAFLGIVMKYIRITKEQLSGSETQHMVHSKLNKFSWLLSASILIILILMFVSPFDH